MTGYIRGKIISQIKATAPWKSSSEAILPKPPLARAIKARLQLSRTKKGLAPEIKDKIYKHQAKYSDIAMIFDDTPVEFVGLGKVSF